MLTLRPFHVALSVLLRLHLHSRPSPLRRALEDSLLREIRSMRSHLTPDLVTLLQHLQDGLASHGAAGQEYFEEVKQELGTQMSALEVPDDLMNIFEGLHDLVNHCTIDDMDSGRPGADANSVLGLYLRQIFVAHAAMPFEAVCKLLIDTQNYFNAAVSALQHGQPLERAAPAAPFGSSLDLERLLRHRLGALDQQVGRLAQQELEEPLQELEGLAPELTGVHLARHLNALMHRDFAASLDYLHRYFDHMACGQGDRLGAALGDEEGMEAAQCDRARLQGASLCLGSLHAHFGHTEEAMAALNETVRIAQQSSDDTCLAHALASLCQILDVTTPSTITSVGQARSTPAATRHHAQLNQLLHHCLRRSEERQLPHLVAYALLALAKFELLHHQQCIPGGAAGAPASCSAALRVGVAVRDTAHLQLASALAAAVPPAPAMSSGTTSARVLRGAPDLFGATLDVFGLNNVGQQTAVAAEVEQVAGSAHLLRSACWDLCGSRHLARSHMLTYLDTFGNVGKCEDQCTALAQLAVSVAASHGHEAAAQVLAAADEMFTHSESKALTMARLTVAHEHALHQGELQEALLIAQQMTGLASPTDTTDITLRLDAEERLARTLLASGQTEAAVKAAHTLFAVSTEAGQPIYSARLLLLLGQAHERRGAPMAALPYALSCAAHCRQLSLDLLGAEVALLLAGLWCDMCPDQPQRGQQQILDVLPLILAHGSVDLRSRAQLQLAEAVMAGHATAASLQSDLEWVLELISSAGHGFRLLEDWQQLARVEYARALVLHAAGQQQERDAAAAAHCKLCEHQSVE